MRKEPIPELEKCYTLIRCESIRHTMMNVEHENFEASAMVAQNCNLKNQQTRSNRQKNGAGNSTYKCTDCDQTGHTKPRWFELVGYPELWDHNHDL